MKRRFLHTALLCLLPLVAWGQDFAHMVATMTSKSLPLVNIEAVTGSVNSTSYEAGSITLSEYKDGTVETTTYSCQLKYRGNYALNLPKKSFNIKLVDDEGEKLDANLLGLRTDNTWILDAMGVDKLRMRNRVCFDIWNEFSPTSWSTSYGNRNGTVGTMVEVFINGNYAGIYHLSDKVNRQLLNLRKARVEDDGRVTIKGLLYKGKGSGVSNALLDYEEDRTDTIKWNTFELQYPDDYPSHKTWQPLMNLIDFNSKTDLKYFSAHHNEWYYTDNLVDYFLLLVVFGIDDMPYKNTFLSTPDINFEHRFMITPWDLDACLGRNANGNAQLFMPLLSRLNAYGPFNRFIFYNIDHFKNRVATRWDELKDSTFAPANLERHIMAIAQRYVESGAWQREYELWKDIPEEEDDRVVIPENIQEEVNYVMNWYNMNYSQLSYQLLRWHNDYVEPEIITAATVTHIYSYILGITPGYDEKYDLNGDGVINSSDVTYAYDVLLSSTQPDR